MAQHNVGIHYAHGRGVPQDDTEAVRWFRLSAEQGFVHGQRELHPPGKQEQAIVDRMLDYRIRRGYVNDYDALVSTLTRNTSSNQFEQSLVLGGPGGAAALSVHARLRRGGFALLCRQPGLRADPGRPWRMLSSGPQRVHRRLDYNGRIASAAGAAAWALSRRRCSISEISGFVWLAK